MSKAIIYTTPTCIFCHALMEWLDGEGFEYEQIDVSDPVNHAKAEEALGHPIEGVQFLSLMVKKFSVLIVQPSKKS